MPNGGTDCCGTCWFNRANEGKRGSAHHNRDISSHCEIRQLDIPNPFYTYCSNHPYHRPDRDPIPIGPVFTHVATGALGEGNREVWQESPDTEEIRKHLLEIVSNPEEHRDKGYHFYTSPAYFKAIEQLIDWRDGRVISALEELARHPGLDKARPSIDGTIQLVRNRLGFDD
ncbi:MAG: hypothetical protein F4X09_07780 [Gammaproteobacteria bacterium]|nr:hypothetical protein [Gammaproteobacteria bacterium]MYC60071.1 hypothetical protein [Gammaproteobacteria bacterium]MYH47347.1 hypothetical protein [Gammaproteobacteria bacterium]MYL12965.1 hypothetical protein [Gammaproteobacteria bacterium]